MSGLVFLAALGGFAALAASMTRHHQDLFGRAPSRLRALVLRGAGGVLLGAALALSFKWLGSPVGFVGWLGLLNVAALATGLALTAARPPSVRRRSGTDQTQDLDDD